MKRFHGRCGRRSIAISVCITRIPVTMPCCRPAVACESRAPIRADPPSWTTRTGESEHLRPICRVIGASSSIPSQRRSQVSTEAHTNRIYSRLPNCTSSQQPPKHVFVRSRLRALGLDLERGGGNLCRLRRHCRLDSQPLQRPSHHARGEIEVLWTQNRISFRLSSSIAGREACERTNCALLKLSSSAFGPARLSTLVRLSGWNRLSVSTKMPRWLVFRLSICFFQSSVHRSLHRNLIASRSLWGRGLPAENLHAMP